MVTMLRFVGVTIGQGRELMPAHPMKSDLKWRQISKSYRQSGVASRYGEIAVLVSTAVESR
jgi:hypothetical protein